MLIRHHSYFLFYFLLFLLPFNQVIVMKLVVYTIHSMFFACTLVLVKSLYSLFLRGLLCALWGLNGCFPSQKMTRLNLVFSGSRGHLMLPGNTDDHENLCISILIGYCLYLTMKQDFIRWRWSFLDLTIYRLFISLNLYASYPIVY